MAELQNLPVYRKINLQIAEKLIFKQPKNKSSNNRKTNLQITEKLFYVFGVQLYLLSLQKDVFR